MIIKTAKILIIKKGGNIKEMSLTLPNGPV